MFFKLWVESKYDPSQPTPDAQAEDTPKKSPKIRQRTRSEDRRKSSELDSEMVIFDISCLS